MADTLFDATLATARVLGIVKEWKASATGSTTTLVDTVGRLESNDHWNQGTVWITYDAGGATVAPEGQFTIVTDFVQSTGTITFQALTVATAANDRYAIANGTVPVQFMIGAINSVLTDVWVPTWDTTSLDTATAQTEYTLPAACTRGNLIRVMVQTNTGDADDNKWVQVHPWWVKEGAKGAQDTLVLPQYTADRDIGLLYRARHPEVFLYSDTINETIDLQALAVHAAVECLHSLMASDTQSNYLAGRLNRLMDKQERMPLTNVRMVKPTKFHVIGDGGGSSYTGEVGKVRL